MSALYLIGESDAISTKRTARAHRCAKFRILYGSRDDSRLAVSAEVRRLENGDFRLFISGPHIGQGDISIILPDPKKS